MENPTIDSEALVKAVNEGVQTAEQTVTLNRIVKSLIGLDLFKGQKTLVESISGIGDLLAKVNAKYQEQLELELSTMSCEGLREEIKFLVDASIKVLEVQRKIVQGKAIFEPAESLTEEEKGILELCKELKTPEQKSLFISTLKEVIEDTKPGKAKKKVESVDDNDFEP